MGCVDFECGTITINKQLIREKKKGGTYKLAPTKNGKPRTVAPDPSIMAVLQKQRERQAHMMQTAGEAWDNPDDLVLTNAFGRYLAHITVYKALNSVMSEIDPPLRIGRPARILSA